MVEPNKYYSYRLTNLPDSLDQRHVYRILDNEDKQDVKAVSLAPSAYQAGSQTATVTLISKPNLTPTSPTDLAPRLRRDGVLGSESIQVDNDFYGLTQLNKVEGDYQGDLIAITGLAGQGFASWQNKSGQMWLRDYLAHDLPGYRIFTYGYPSKVRQSLTRAIIPDFAEHLAREIGAIRSSSEAYLKPLILVGHSLGCIVIKQLITDSAFFGGPVHNLHRQVVLLVFFGAPHRGLDNPELATVVKETPPDNLVRDLQPNSSLLILLNQYFPKACKGIKILSCFETEETLTYRSKDPKDPKSAWERTGPPRYMVPPSSACLDWPNDLETRLSVRADHSGIAKLDNSPGSSYYSIRDEIQKVVKIASNVLEIRKEEDMAFQTMLSLFFLFQYEYHWFRAWLNYRNRQSPSRLGAGETDTYTSYTDVDLSIPYGDEAYPPVTEASSLLVQLTLILQRHRTSEGGVDLTAIAEIIRIPEPSNKNNQESNYRYTVDGWSTGDRDFFRTLLLKLQSINNQLSQLTDHSNSFGLLASSQALASGSQGSLQANSHYSRSDWYSSLVNRSKLKSQYQLNNNEADQGDMIYPIGRLERKEGTGLSNYRVVTQLRQPEYQTSPSKISPSWVLVEWRSYKTAPDLKTQQQAKKQAIQLAQDLHFSSKPPLLKVLPCKGLVQDDSDQSFGLLFSLPPEADIGHPPRTLFSILPSGGPNDTQSLLPTLRDRIDLARALAYSVAELHAAHILHKSLHSGNVIFFPARFASAADLSISDPYIGGFEVSRPDQKGELSVDMGGTRTEVYLHPELRDPSNELQGRPSSERRHDVYALGLILLEIGVWKRVESLTKRGLDARGNASRLLEIAKRYVPHHMGTRYCEAVVTCIDIDAKALRRGVSGGNSEDEKGGVSLQLFLEKVIQPLETCRY